VHPSGPPDCSYIHLTVPPDQNAFYISKSIEWGNNPLVGNWFKCNGAPDVMLWWTYAQQQATKRPPQPAEDPVPFLFKNGCHGGCTFQYIYDERQFTFNRPAGCDGCNTLQVLIWTGDGTHLAWASPEIEVDAIAPIVTITPIAPYIHGTTEARWWLTAESQAQITERPPLPEYVQGVREFMKEKP
jgi:hypothetical protein